VRPVPIFAVQAALALGSSSVRRRYMTSQRNYSELYFLNVAKSGTGKEEAKTTIERILTAAGARRLIAGSSYSSGNAVFSALLKKPQHITIIDEFGKYLEAASGDARQLPRGRADAADGGLRPLHGDMATPQFSTMTLSPRKPQANHEPRIIARPAITLLAMTTPSTFYNTMRRRDPRRLPESLPRRRAPGATHADGEWTDVPVPEKAAQWIVQMLSPQGESRRRHADRSRPDPDPGAADSSRRSRARGCSNAR
jgi:hypothetical protein